MRKIILLIMFMLFSSTSFCAEKLPGLPVGSFAPDFTAVNHQGEEVQLSNYFEEGPVVLIFYRGSWCYYCNLQLQEYQKNFSEFNDRGVSLLFVSVDTQAKAAEMMEEKAYDFEVISNPDAKILELYKVVYQVPQDLAKKYKEEYHIDLQEASGREDRIIAVPATYIIDQSGKIVYVYANVDYKVRTPVTEVLDIIDQKL